MILSQYLAISAIAVFIEGTIEWIFDSDFRKNRKAQVALAAGFIFALAANFNPLSMLKVTSPIPYFTTIAGYIMGGISLARGTNYLSDFLGMINGKSFGASPPAPKA